MSVEVQRQIVFAWLDVQALEPAVEVVNPAREIAVDEHFGFARGYLQLQRRFFVEEREICRMTTARGASPPS